MKLFAKFLAVNCLTITILGGAPKAHAWVPCSFICDSQCLGTQMALKSLEHAAKLSEIQAELLKAVEKTGAAKEQVKKSSKEIADAWDSAGIDFDNLVLGDSALKVSKSTRTVESIRALSENLELQNTISRAGFGSTIAEFQNTLSSSISAALTLTGEQMSRSQTPDISDESVQNSWEIINRDQSRKKSYEDIILQSLVYSHKLEEVSGKSVLVSNKKKNSIRKISDLMFKKSSLDEDSWLLFGFIDDQSLVPAFVDIVVDEQHRGGEFSDLDLTKLKLGSSIDLQGLRLLKMQRSNLFLLETLNAKNFQIKGIGYEY